MPRASFAGSLVPFARLLAAVLALVLASPARAAGTATFTATALQPLSFGTLVTANGGSMTVAPDGTTTTDALFALPSSFATPAEFTLTYTQPPGQLISLVVVFQFSLPAVPNQSVSGIQGKLTNYTTDLPGVATLQPGQVASYTMPVCISTSCSVTFHVGGTLTVTRSSGGGVLTFPLTLQSTVTTLLG